MADTQQDSHKHDIAGLRSGNLAFAVVEHDSPIVAWHQKDEVRYQRISIVENCITDGYAPKGYGVIDFSIVRVGRDFHLFHIAHVMGYNYNDPGHTTWLGHAVSTDLDTWTTLAPCLHVNAAAYYESAHVWAPFVFPTYDRYLMFYTGVTAEPSQTLCVAESGDPELKIWNRTNGNPIIPLEGFDWHWLNDHAHVRNARDPHLVQVDDCHLLAYTALHKDGCGAVGGLLSTDLATWEDIGPLLYRKSRGAEGLPESVNIQQMPDGLWALIPSLAPGLEYYLSDSPFGWHHSRPTQIECDNVDREKLYALEVLKRDDEAMLWLVAYFDSLEHRLRIGTMNCRKHPWTIRQAESASEIERWLE